MEATAGFEPAIGVLQTPALPLGHVALLLHFNQILRTKLLALNFPTAYFIESQQVDICKHER